MNIHISKKLISISAGLVLSLLLPILAHAGCEQSDLQGVWYTYGMSVDSLDSFAPQTNRCKVKLNSSGSVVASKSSCKVRSWPGLINVNITGGSIKVSSSCSLSGSVKVDGIQGPNTIKLEYGSAATDKRTFSFVAYSGNDPSYITHMTGVKR